jgi:hypothetical protein
MTGMQTAELERALRAGAKFLYALPNFQNPAGVTIPLERRHRIVELADHYGVPILEDDPYGQLRYEGEHLPPIVAVDAEFQSNDGRLYTGNVIYLSTFSKTLAPGLRLGWIVAPEGVIERLVLAKQGTDLHTSTFAQMIAYEAARGGFIDEHVRMLRREYRERRDAMLHAMAEHFPPSVTWTRPRGGLFLWVRFPEGWTPADVLREAIKERVAFVVGSAFYADGSGRNTARFNFSNSTPDLIREGIGRLAMVLQRMVAGKELTEQGVRSQDLELGVTGKSQLAAGGIEGDAPMRWRASSRVDAIRRRGRVALGQSAGNPVLHKLRTSGYRCGAVNPQRRRDRRRPLLPGPRQHSRVHNRRGGDRHAPGCVGRHRAPGGGPRREAGVAASFVRPGERLGRGRARVRAPRRRGIVGGCPLMYCEPIDVAHRCMRWILGWRGRVPR